MAEAFLLAFQAMTEQQFNRMIWTVLLFGGVIMAFGVVMIILFMRALDRKTERPGESQLYLGLLLGVVFVLCIVFLYIAYRVN